MFGQDITLKENINEFNEDYYNEMVSDLSEEKPDIIEKIENENIGQIILPTGSGKSVIQNQLVINDVKDKLDETNIYLIASHRLLLNKQLLMKISENASKLNIDYNVMFVGSVKEKNIINEFDDMRNSLKSNSITSTCLDSSNILSSTKPKEIKEFVQKTIDDKRQLLIVSTYHSLDKLFGIPKNINIALFDEAHTIVGDGFLKNVKQVFGFINKKYYFTATKKDINTDDGMADEDVFGNVISFMSVREAIDRRMIVPCRLHFINNVSFVPEITVDEEYENEDDDVDVDYSSLSDKVKTIIEAFEAHKNQIDVDSYDNSKQGAKLLYCLNKQKELKNIVTSDEFKEYCSKNNIKTIAVCSDHKYINGIKCNSIDIDQELNSLKNSDTEDVMIFHLRMLTEGIDLPSITGIMIFNHKELSTLMQSIGRCIRLNKSDRNNISNNKEFKDMIKPFGYVILPSFINHEDMSKMTKMIKELFTIYGIKIEEVIKPELYGDGDKLDENDIRKKIIKNDKCKIINLIHNFEDICKEEEKSSFKKQLSIDFDELEFNDILTKYFGEDNEN